MQIRFIRTLLFALLFALVMLCMSASSFAQVGVLITFAPPPLPIYEQPICPEDGYIWTPGYWAYGDDFDDYYWVPGTWVLAPEVGFLWTPGYWGWGGDGFVFYDGYWGPLVGFYGGINYGFGYFGEGYEGGRWDNGRFFYNRSVNNVNETVVRNVYNTTVINNNNENHVSYNGGNGGVNARPTPQQEAAAHEKHIPPVPVQTQHAQAARTNPQQRASVNMGKPPVAATPKPGVFNHPAVVPAKAPGAPYTPPSNRAANRGGSQPRNNASAPANSAPANPAPRPETSAPRTNNSTSRPSAPTHPSDLPPAARSSAPNTGNPKLDQKYQQQQEKVFAKQEQERQKLQQRQDQEHQRLAQQNASEAAKQQVEQRHQQQTQQLQQRHEQQQQQLQQKQQPQQQPPSRDRSKPPN
jgi:hypothetical protein